MLNLNMYRNICLLVFILAVESSILQNHYFPFATSLPILLRFENGSVHQITIGDSASSVSPSESAKITYVLHPLRPECTEFIYHSCYNIPTCQTPCGRGLPELLEFAFEPSVCLYICSFVNPGSIASADFTLDFTNFADSYSDNYSVLRQQLLIGNSYITVPFFFWNKLLSGTLSSSIIYFHEKGYVSVYYLSTAEILHTLLSFHGEQSSIIFSPLSKTVPQVYVYYNCSGEYAPPRKYEKFIPYDQETYIPLFLYDLYSPTFKAECPDHWRPVAYNYSDFVIHHINTR